MSQEKAERARWLATEEALTRLRRDFQLRAVQFGWERRKPPAGSTAPEKLIGVLKGEPGKSTPFQAAAFALTLIQPFFPSAVIEGGGLTKTKKWVAILWLDAPEGEAVRREELHPGLEPPPNPEAEKRCPHDGATCKGRPSVIIGVPPPLCEGVCARERNGRSLPKPHQGYPLDGHEFPAVKATR